ncbi:hypothetical protein AK812_SmicGene21409 [Symbiodinium microadriaticum]|uniref:Uncharacterized protein n=1 Tax=Symbiodinium microadriaticum TaxID=2951 RepID=A0A1Q9DMK9_SYMMI|nr:hypothetical protein AK812_SmicGene21409 [Symbiodinium microadriaticum]
MGWAADIADYGYEHGITDFMEAWHKYMDPGPDWDPDNPEWQARQRQQQRQEQAERDARDRSRSRERRRAQAPDKIAAVVRTCIAKGQTRKDLFAACEIVGVDDPLAVAESGEEIVQRIYERLDDEVLNATQWVLLEASKSVEKAVFVGIVEFDPGLLSLHCDVSSREHCQDTGEVSGAAFRPRFWGTSLAQEAPFLADAPAGSPTNLSVFEASGLIGDRGAVYLTRSDLTRSSASQYFRLPRPYLSAVEPFYEVQAKLANESLRSDAPINRLRVAGGCAAHGAWEHFQPDPEAEVWAPRRWCYPRAFHGAVREVRGVISLSLDVFCIKWDRDAEALAAEVVPLRSGYIDLDEPNHCVWTVGPETIKCFEIDTLEECFRLLQRDQAPLLRHTLGLFALVWASSEHLAMVVYSAGGMKHFDSEVQMQNLVTVVEILTMDVFLCQSQGEDAQLLDVSKGQQLCTLPSTEHWQLPNIAVLTHLGVILVTLPGTLQIWRYATWDSGASCWPVKDIDFQGSFSQRTLVDRARASLVLPQAPSASGRGDDLFLIDLRCCKRPERFQRGVCFDGGGLAFIQGDLSEGWLLVCGRQGGGLLKKTWSRVFLQPGRQEKLQSTSRADTFELLILGVDLGVSHLAFAAIRPPCLACYSWGHGLRASWPSAEAWLRLQWNLRGPPWGYELASESASGWC